MLWEATFDGVSFFPFRIWVGRVLDDVSSPFGLSSFVLGHLFLLGVGFGLNIKWAEIVKFFGPTIAPQNPAVWLLGRKGGFWYPRAFIMACQVLSSISTRAFSLV